MRPVRRRSQRTAAIAVEMAFIIPVVLLVFFGLWEWSRVEMIKHVTENAVFVGARHGTLPGATDTSTEAKVQEILDIYLINAATVDASFDAGTGESTVTATVSIDANVSLGYAFFAGKQFTTEMTLIQ